MKNKVFLGGTCAESTWRNELINFLDIDYFNPVVDDWNESCQVEEQQKEHHCNIHLYVITKEMIGAFSIAEAIESAMTKGKITIFHVLPEGFNGHQLKSFKSICKMIESHGGYAGISDNLADVSFILNHQLKNENFNTDSFQDRLGKEKHSLQEKYDKLYTFIDTKTYNKLRLGDRALLRTQLSTMKSYLIILEERLRRQAPDLDSELDYY